MQKYRNVKLIKNIAFRKGKTIVIAKIYIAERIVENTDKTSSGNKANGSEKVILVRGFKITVQDHINCRFNTKFIYRKD